MKHLKPFDENKIETDIRTCFDNLRDDFNLDIDNLYDNGLQRGKVLGHNNFDNLFSFASSQLTVVTGVPTHGKSNFLEYMAMKLSALHGWKFGVFSPEHYPMQLHFSVLAEKLIGKSFRKITRYNRMTKNELNLAKQNMDGTEKSIFNEKIDMTI